MTSNERIRKILDFQRPDRIGIHDAFLDTTIERWKSDGFPRDVTPEEYFGFDLDIINIEDVLADNIPGGQKGARFNILAFSEPFQKLCDIMGREYALRRLALYPKDICERLANLAYSLLDSIEKVFKKDISFDGAWVWGDVAYQKGLFFSPEWYRKNLLPLHRKIFRFVSSRGLAVFFHSDGNISDIIPDLLDSGVRAVHPLEENCGMDMDRLFALYKNDMVFMGHMDLEKIIRGGDFSGALTGKIKYIKDRCYYIYCSDYPIMPNITRQDYEKALEAVKAAGTY